MLKEAVENQSNMRQVKYVTPGEHSRLAQVFYSKSTVPKPCHKLDVVESQRQDDPSPQSCDVRNDNEEVSFQVTCPSFYSRSCHYSSLFAALQGELLSEKRARTSCCSEPQRFVDLFCPARHNVEELPAPDWRWSMTCWLRRNPIPHNFASDEQCQSFKGLSSTDEWVIRHCTPIEQREYRRALLLIYLGQRFGGISIGAFEMDLELVGLSREGVLKIYEAVFKTLVVVGLTAVMARVGGPVFFHPIGQRIVAVIFLYLWACFKSWV